MKPLETDPSSTLLLYRHAIAVRRERLRSGAGLDAGLVWLDVGADVVAFGQADSIRCVVNMGDEPVTLPAGVVLLASGPIVGDQLPPDTAVWLR